MIFATRRAEGARRGRGGLESPARPGRFPHATRTPPPVIRPGDSAPDDSLDEAFPLGDGTADTGATVRCPYCWEDSEVALDPGSGAFQEYVEDCPVCCRPWTVRVAYRGDGTAEVDVEAADEA